MVSMTLERLRIEMHQKSTTTVGSVVWRGLGCE